eukprot:5589176-Pleurochrysis_carterae.AAC.1
MHPGYQRPISVLYRTKSTTTVLLALYAIWKETRHEKGKQDHHLALPRLTSSCFRAQLAVATAVQASRLEKTAKKHSLNELGAI